MVAPHGFIERFKGRIIASADSLQMFGRGGASSKSGGNIYMNASTTGFGNTSDTTEDTLDTYSLPANSLYNVGAGLNIYAWGTFGGNAHTKTAKLYFGSETVSQQTTSSSTPWVLEMNILKTAANQQVLSTQAIISTTHSGCTSTTGAETDTNAITLKVTGQVVGVSTANDVVLNGWFITGYYF